jgi:predicted nucleic acid-binding protein
MFNMDLNLSVITSQVLEEFCNVHPKVKVAAAQAHSIDEYNSSCYTQELRPRVMI